MSILKYITGVFSDYGIKSAQSAEEAESTIFGANYDDNKKLAWHKKPAHTFEEKDIRDWITSIVPIGNRQRFLKELSKRKITNGTLLSEMTFLEFFGIIKAVSKVLEIKPDEEVNYLLHFTHFLWSFNNRKNMSKSFHIVLKKFMKMFYINEYYFLLNNVMLGKMKEIGEKAVSENCRHVFGYALIILDKSRVYEKFIDHFENMIDNNEQKFIVKLIVIDQIGEENEGTAENKVLQRKTKLLISPILSAIPFLNPEFGIFHVGVQLGSENLYCEWTTNSIIMLKELNTTSPVCTLDFPPVFITQMNYKRIAKSISDCIHKWNTEKEYSLVSLNCQHFPIDLAKSLNIEMCKDGAFKKFLSRIKQTGNADMILKPANSFLEKYINDENNKRNACFTKFMHRKKDFFVFEKHRYLDRFCSKILERCGDNEEMKKELIMTSEWKLLTSWDECFWIKYFNITKKDFEREDYENLKYYCKNSDDEEIEGEKEDEILCPFYNATKEKEVFEKITKKEEEWNESLYNEQTERTKQIILEALKEEKMYLDENTL